MPRPQSTSERLDLAFCPFCHEAFEGRSECPEHELTLVSLDELTGGRRARLERVEFFVDPRLGRGAPLVGVALVLVGFLAPFVRSSALRASALEVAIDGAGNLWLTPGVGLAVAWILWRRRSRKSMQAARAAVLGLALGGALPLVYTCWRISVMADARDASATWLAGLWLMAAGLCAIAIGGRSLGSGFESGGVKG